MSLLETFPQLPACCLCLSLRAGCLATSVYLLVESILIIVGKSIFLAMDNPQIDGMLTPRDVENFSLNDSVVGVIFWNILAQILVQHAPQLILAIVLFIGAIKAKIQLIAFYSWLALLVLIIEFALLTVSLLTYPIVAIYHIPLFGLHIYLWLCVNSYYLYLREEQEIAYKRKFNNGSTKSFQR